MSNVNVLIGIDCDVPRSDVLSSREVNYSLANKVFDVLKNTKFRLNELSVKRTYFICGMFLEYMEGIFGKSGVSELFDTDSTLSEIADHTYSHRVFAKIKSRPDKAEMLLSEISEEYRYNTILFNRIFGKNYDRRGIRTPLGHYNGLRDKSEVVSLLKEEGVLYVSSDLRDRLGSICPPLVENGQVRQPYYYECGLLEIPSHGWHDTAFSRTTSSPLYFAPPHLYIEIMSYYRRLFTNAKSMSEKNGKSFYLGLVLHPSSIVYYDIDNKFWYDLFELSKELNVNFMKYDDVFELHK